MVSKVHFTSTSEKNTVLKTCGERTPKFCYGVYLIPHKTPGLQEIGKRKMMYLKTPQGFVPDNFSHEQSLVIDTDKGLVTVRRRERTT